MRLDQKVIVVTGTGSGLGKAMAKAFVSEGANVVCADVNEQRLSEALVDISDGPGDATDVIVDVRSWDDVQAMIETAHDEYGPIDLMVNNVGIRQWHLDGGGRKPAWEVPVDVWRTVIDTNITGTFLCTKAAVPSMLERGQGRVMHLSSGMGIEGQAQKSAYTTTKFGIEGFHDSLTKELEGTGVESIAFRPPGSGVHTAMKEELGISGSTIDDPNVIAEPTVQLAAGAGENGGRYRGTEDGEGFTEYSRSD